MSKLDTFQLSLSPLQKLMIIWQVELAKGLGFGDLSKSEVLKTYMLDKAYQAVRERTPDLGYTFLVGSCTPRISLNLKPCVFAARQQALL